MMRTTLTVQGSARTRPYKTFGARRHLHDAPHEEFVTDELFHPHVVHSAPTS